jgi:hypothetical protein
MTGLKQFSDLDIEAEVKKFQLRDAVLVNNLILEGTRLIALQNMQKL